MAGTGVSGALFVASQFSAVRSIFVRHRLSSANDVWQSMDEIDSCSVTAKSALSPEIGEPQRDITSETITTDMGLVSTVDDFKAEPVEISVLTSGGSQSEMETEETYSECEQTESINQQSIESEPIDNTCSETKPRRRRSKGNQISEKADTEKQPDENLDEDTEFVSLLKMAEANAKTEDSLTEEKPDNSESKSLIQEPTPITVCGCPKNLAYYNQTPRPKEPPAECYTCSNLIACVYGKTN